MSRSWADLFSSTTLYLGPGQVLLRARGALHAAVPAAPGWAGALAALQSLLEEHKPGGSVAVVLSSHFAPLWLLPGAPTRLNHEETRGWVASQAAERFGELAANWRLAFRPAPAGEPILTAGVDAGHWAELMRALTQAGLKAISVTSWPALALARYGKGGKRGTARLALVEAGRITLASLLRGNLAALDSVRGEPAALAGLAARATLVDGLGADSADIPLQLVGTGIAGDWRSARVLANAPEAAILSGRGDPDFLQTRPRPPLAAWLLLGAGLGMAALAGHRYTALADQLAALSVPDSATASAKPRRASAAASPDTPARPWGDLLNRLESQRPKQIALLSLRGDALRGEVRITAEARSASDMLAWLKTLRSDAGFNDASLVQHTVQEEDGQHPLRFEIRLGWGSR